MRALIEMLAAGTLHPHIHGHLPLAEAKRAHEMLESGAVLGYCCCGPDRTQLHTRAEYERRAAQSRC